MDTERCRKYGEKRVRRLMLLSPATSCARREEGTAKAEHVQKRLAQAANVKHMEIDVERDRTRRSSTQRQRVTDFTDWPYRTLTADPTWSEQISTDQQYASPLEALGRRDLGKAAGCRSGFIRGVERLSGAFGAYHALHCT